MPASRAELAIQNATIDLLTELTELMKIRNRTPEEFFIDNPIYLGKVMMLSQIVLRANYDMRLDIPDHLIDMLL